MWWQNLHFGRRARVGLVCSSVLAMLGIGFFQNCSGKFAVTAMPEEMALSSTMRASPESSEPENSLASKIACQFIGPDILSDRLKFTFNIPIGDVPVLNTNGIPTTKMRIRESLVTLGKGDVNQGRPDDWNCGTTKFKASAEVMIDACAIALRDVQVKEKLFPPNLAGFDSLYHHLLGRLPTIFERDVLAELATKISADKAEAAVCGAVATSFESLIRI